MSEEIIKVPEGGITDVPAIADDRLVQIAEQADKRVASIIKIKKVALMVTNAHDWTDQQGKPYLQVSGAEKIARLFGISWRIGEPTRDNFEDGHYSFSYKGEFSLSGTTIEAIGSRSSKDGFFKKYSYVEKEKIELPPSEIDPGDVKKAAYTNLIGNGITRLLGIRNLTYEELAEFAGIKREQVQKVEYKKGGKQSDTSIASDEANTVTVMVTDVRKKEGEKNGKKWTLYTIKNGEKSFSTFSEQFAVVAKNAMNEKHQVTITYRESNGNLNIENISAVKDVKQPTPENPLGV